MKRLIAWLTRRQRCTCGNFKLARAATCFDCNNEAWQRLADAQNVEQPF